MRKPSMASEPSSLDTIFCAAIAIASAQDRAAYIAQACERHAGSVEPPSDASFTSGGS
jgi:hypothetical protein